MNEQKYYDGTKLLSQKDINGNQPELYLCTTNRTGGKTTYFNRLMINSFLKGKGKFCLLYRYSYELDDVAEKFFKDIKELFFNEYDMEAEKRCKGAFVELFLYKDGEESNAESCGYAVALNSSENVKKYSHYFSDVERMLFDEFQSEIDKYCPKEIEKFISIHTSIARGRGKQVRYVPVYMLANAVTIINPYYVALGISNRLKDDTKFLKGDGFVLEQGYIDSASKAILLSPFNRAFKDNQYVSYSAQNIYLNDSKAFIETPVGCKSRYVATIKYANKEYAIRTFESLGIIYVDDKPDNSFPIKIAITTDDMNINYVMLNNYNYLILNLRDFFNRGCFRFKNIQCKDVLLHLIAYY